MGFSVQKLHPLSNFFLFFFLPSSAQEKTSSHPPPYARAPDSAATQQLLEPPSRGPCPARVLRRAGWVPPRFGSRARRSQLDTTTFNTQPRGVYPSPVPFKSLVVKKSHVTVSVGRFHWDSRMIQSHLADGRGVPCRRHVPAQRVGTVAGPRAGGRRCGDPGPRRHPAAHPSCIVTDLSGSREK